MLHALCYDDVCTVVVVVELVLTPEDDTKKH